MNVTPRINKQAMDLARRIEFNAPNIQNALDHIADEIAWADSHPTATLSDGGSRGNQELNSVEAAVERRWQLAADRAQILDDLKALDDIFTSMMKVVRFTQGVRLKVDESRCYTDPGLEGYLLSIEEGGWSNPACTNKPRTGKGGLCDPCRQRLDRYRQRRDLKVLADERDIDYPSTVYIDEQGVAHTRLIQGAA